MAPKFPSAPAVQVSPDITIQPPLSRRGGGPGLVLVVSTAVDLSEDDKTLDPPPLKKWAEESYAVAQVLVNDSFDDVQEKLSTAIAELKKLPELTGDKFGLVVIHDKDTGKLVEAIRFHSEIVASVFYGCRPTSEPPVPALVHLGAKEAPKSEVKATVYTYPSATGFFNIPASPDYKASASSVSHTRSLTFLKPLMDGPYFDLEKIWEEHTYFEFADRSVEETMATMVDQPYVNHIPVLTGGIGRAHLTNFYRDHFIFSNPRDTELELVSRTVGIDRIVDEFLLNCTHDCEIDWLIPGIPPTHKKLSIPFTSIVNIRGDRLYHEHIAWDQGTVLRQLGLLPEYLPFPYPLPEGHRLASSKQLEFRVPVAGVETAKKLTDENACPSNELLQFTVREAETRN